MRTINRRTFTYSFLTLPLLGLSGCQTGPTQSRPNNEVILDEDPPAPQVGEEFHYEHEGPKPFGDGETDHSGVRAVGTIAQTGENQQFWEIQEVFETSRGIISYLIDADYLLHRQLIVSDNGELTVEIQPAWPQRYLNLLPDESDSMRIVQEYYQPEGDEPIARAQIDLDVTRSYDERIVTPEGAFLCRSFDAEMLYRMEAADTRIRYTVNQRSYWSDQFSWFIREEYDFGPVQQGSQEVRPAYQCTSTLKEYFPPKAS